MGAYTQEQIDAGKETAAAALANTGDQAGYDSAMSFWNSQVAVSSGPEEQTEAEAVEESPKEEASGPSFSVAAKALMRSSGLGEEDFIGYERVTVPVVEALLASLEPVVEDEPVDDAPESEELEDEGSVEDDGEPESEGDEEAIDEPWSAS